MFSKYPEIKDSMLGRPQSPAAEDLMRDGIHDALKALMEESYLYRNRTIDLAPILKLGDKVFPAAALEDEFQHRPWSPYSRNRGFTKGEVQIMSGEGGTDAIGTPPRDKRLTFILPTVTTWCAACKGHHLHDSIPHIEFSPYHLNPEAIKEASGRQSFLLNYQCHRCKGSLLTFMVRREKAKLQLCGRSEPYFPEVPGEIPTAVRKIYADAVGAVACGDLSGGFYHLRTLMEHHMKAACGIPLAQQVVGSELCTRYNGKIDPVASERAALTNAFERCSEYLHSRTGTPSDFEGIRMRLTAHFQLLATLAKFAS